MCSNFSIRVAGYKKAGVMLLDLLTTDTAGSCPFELRYESRTGGDQYWVLPPPLVAPLALSCLIRCSSMLAEAVAPS